MVSVIPKGIVAGKQGQVWTWLNGKAVWADLPPTPVSALTFGYVFAPITPLVGTSAITVFTLIFPTTGITAVHLNIQGLMINLSEDTTVSLPCDVQGNFRVVDLSPPNFATVNEVGLQYCVDTTWHWQSVTNIDHNEVSLILTPDPLFWNTDLGLTQPFGPLSTWTFNFQAFVRSEYCQANPTQYMPKVVSTYALWSLDQVYPQ